MSVRLSPKNAAEEHVAEAAQASKVTFKKDAAEVLLATTFELLV